MKRMALCGLIVFVFSLAFGQDAYSPIIDLISALARADVPTRGADVSVGAVCGSTIETLGGDTNRFFDLARDYCTNLCVRVGTTNRNGLVQYRGVMNLLRDYDSAQSKTCFAYCVTNSLDESMIFISALCYSECASVFERGCLYRDVLYRSCETRDAVSRGMIRAFELNGGSVAETNQMALLGLNMISNQVSSWPLVDKGICLWWPAYATSSNRYIAAQLARQAVPPCASSNYLNRVIAELEALPSGTMQMLSTNHLGQAWEE